jgi:hypothetical protein
MGMMMCREAPFAASLFWLQPILNSAATNIFGGGSDGGSAVSDGGCNGEGVESLSPSIMLRYVAVGVTTSVLATPISHVPSVVAAYQQGHGVGRKDAVAALLAAGGWRELW